MTPSQFLSSWSVFSGQVAAAISTNASDEALARLISERVRGQRAGRLLFFQMLVGLCWTPS